MSNRRRHTNSVPASKLVILFFAAAVIGCVALSYVYLKHQAYRTGGEIKQLEREIAALKNQNDVMHTRITALTSHPELERKRKDGIIQLEEIAMANIVKLNDSMPVLEEDGIRAVANRDTTP